MQRADFKGREENQSSSRGGNRKEARGGRQGLPREGTPVPQRIRRPAPGAGGSRPRPAADLAGGVALAAGFGLPAVRVGDASPEWSGQMPGI